MTLAPTPAPEMSDDEMRFTMWRHKKSGFVTRLRREAGGAITQGSNGQWLRTWFEGYEPYDAMRQGWPSELEKTR